MTTRDPLLRDTPDEADAGHRALHEALTALARADADLEAPAHVEEAVLRAWDSRHTGLTRRARRPLAVALSMAAAVALGIGATLSRSPARPIPDGAAVAATDVALPAVVDPAPGPGTVKAPASAPSAPRTTSRPSPPQPPATRPAAARPATTVVLVGSPITPGEPVHLVRMRIARETLREMGLRPIAASGDGPVDVEMLVGEDGVARGLRVSM